MQLVEADGPILNWIDNTDRIRFSFDTWQTDFIIRNQAVQHRYYAWMGTLSFVGSQ